MKMTELLPLEVYPFTVIRVFREYFLKLRKHFNDYSMYRKYLSTETDKCEQ